jgi:MYXO-CTERM domain-containing protein
MASLIFLGFHQMKIKSILSALLSAAALTLTLGASAQAALVNRGGGMIYDTTRNITWLADMNYAKTSGYTGTGVNFSGTMTWNAATTWAENLVFGGFSDWRLPTTTQPDATCDTLDFGGQRVGSNCTGSEMGHLWYTELGNTAGSMTKRGDFQNLQSYSYWSGTENVRDSDRAWYFRTDIGTQDHFVKADQYYAMAVRPGDVPAATVPEPGTGLLAVAALAGLGVLRRRRAVRSSGL